MFTMVTTKAHRFGGQPNQPGDEFQVGGESHRRLVKAMGWAHDKPPEDFTPPARRAAASQPKRATATKAASAPAPAPAKPAEPPQPPQTPGNPAEPATPTVPREQTPRPIGTVGDDDGAAPDADTREKGAQSYGTRHLTAEE